MENFSQLLCLSVPGVSLIAMGVGRIVAKMPFSQFRLIDRYNHEEATISNWKAVLAHKKVPDNMRSEALRNLGKVQRIHLFKRILFGNLEKASHKHQEEVERQTRAL